MPSLEFKGKTFVHSHHLTVPFRELVLDETKSCVTKGKKPSLEDNLIIHGDNLHALKALLPTHAGKVDCIFIDPPYNTGNEGWCYNDAVRSPLMKAWLAKSANPVDKEDLERHDKWLCMMWPRLQLLRELLSEDGAIFVTIDDNEVHRLRAVMDEVLGEANFAACCIWHKMDSPKNTAQYFSVDHDYVLVYAKSLAAWSLNLLPRNEQMLARYRNLDNDPRGPWMISDLDARNYYSKGTYAIKTPSGRLIEGPPPGRYWSVSEDKFWALNADKRIWWGEKGDSPPNIKRFLSEVKSGVVPQTIWPWQQVGSTRHSKGELVQIVGGVGDDDDVFITPKPVALVQRVLEIAANKDSLILDSFAGSGTTAHAVLAMNQKDGGNRRFILVETEDYADTLTAERVRRVIEGYAFTGTQRTELLREPLTWTKLKKGQELAEKAESVKALEGSHYDNVTIKVEDGALVVTGEKNVKKKTDGLGGSFTYCELGQEMNLDAMLGGSGKLPDYAALARYVFHTATGRTLEKAPTKRAKDGFIGETDLYRVHLHYEPDAAWLRSNAASVDAALVEAVAKGKPAGKRALVFAAAKFMSQKALTPQGIEFCQLPYAIHRGTG